MAFSRNALRFGAWTGLFSSGAALGVLVEKKSGPGQVMKSWKKTNIHKSLTPADSTPAETKEVLKFHRGCEILKYGVPTSLVPQTLYYDNHVLEFDPQRKTPKWVAEHITRGHVEPVVETPANRKLARFSPDPNLPPEISASNDDFWDSGWSRGHMAPAGNNKHSQEAMNHTFYLSNIVPQDLDNNGDFWNRFEIYCRDLTNKFSDVRIISGPLWKPIDKLDVEQEEVKMWNGKKAKPHKIMKYPVIGSNEVSVPTHLFKILLVEDPSLQAPLMAAFVIPNKPISRNQILTDFKVDIGEIESCLGLRFHSQLDRAPLQDLCQVDGCQMQDYRSFQSFFIKRGMTGARTINELSRYWKKAKNLDLVDPELMEIYDNALQRISEKVSQENDSNPKKNSREKDVNSFSKSDPISAPTAAAA